MRPIKLPPEAFNFFAGLGPTRTFGAVASHFGVSLRTVMRRALIESWRQRLEDIEIKAREAVEKKVVETVAQMNDRHLRAMRIIQAKALEALKSLSLESAMDAVRALDLATKQERLIRGEPIERTAISIEETVRREYERWLVLPAGTSAPTGIGMKEVVAHDAGHVARQHLPPGPTGPRLLTQGTGSARDPRASTAAGASDEGAPAPQ